MFGSPITWVFPGARPTTASVPGVLCTIIIFVVLALYSGYRLDILLNREDFNVLTEVQNDFFTEDFTVRGEDGFRVAATVTNYGDTSDIEDPSIGTVEIYEKSWLADGSPLRWRKLKTRPCDENLDFNLDGTVHNATFDNIHFKSVSLAGYIDRKSVV